LPREYFFSDSFTRVTGLMAQLFRGSGRFFGFFFTTTFPNGVME
jgi:hypothetical protein